MPLEAESDLVILCDIAFEAQGQFSRPQAEHVYREAQETSSLVLAHAMDLLLDPDPAIGHRFPVSSLRGTLPDPSKANLVMA